MSHALNSHKIAFITCVNDEAWYSECLLYVEHLHLPTGFSVDYIPVRGAISMAEGYNTGMRKSDAKYKIYLHQDTLVVHKRIIYDLLELFQHEEIGMVGVIGARSMPASGCWWDGLRPYGRVLHACEAESIVDTRLREPEDRYISVEVIDGLFMATQYDIPWRSDVFTHWHFYDASQCREFARRGYQTVIPNQENGFWCIHCPVEKPLAPEYTTYQRLFLETYQGEFHPEV